MVPNIFVMTDDQHHAACLGCDDRPQVQTPNLDRLASEGVYCRRGYSVSPTCVPSRCSFLTGQYPHTHGIYGEHPEKKKSNHATHPASTITLPGYLKQQLGYTTGIIGKRHFDRFPVEPFDTSTGEIMEGYYNYLKQQGLFETYQRETIASINNMLGYETSIGFEHSEQQWVANTTIDWINQHGDKPFFLWTNWSDPHPYYRTAADYPVRYDPDEIDLSQIRNSSAEAERIARLSFMSDRKGVENIMNRSVVGEAQYRRTLAHYYGMISAVDHSVGRIVGHLDQQGLLDNTLIIFLSDHGDFAGEYGMMGKNARGHYDCIFRIPFIWYWRGHFGIERHQGFVRNIDIFPTLCDLLEIQTPAQVQGESFADVLRWSKSASGPLPDSCETTFFDGVYCKSVRTRRYQMNVLHAGATYGELFDLQHDPDALNNLYDEPRYAHIRKELTEALLHWYMRTEQPLTDSPGNHLQTTNRWHRQFTPNLGSDSYRMPAAT